MNISIVVIIASAVWFFLAAVLFFNPVVDKIYKSQEGDSGVRVLPKSLKTISMILLAVFIQCILWSVVFKTVSPALPEGALYKGFGFGLILISTKMIPRDIDRLLLSTYPRKRMLIEFIIGAVCCICVGVVFAALL